MACLPGKAVALDGKASHVTVIFRVLDGKTSWGESLRVVGTLSELGSWSPDEAIALRTDARCCPEWRSGKVHISKPHSGIHEIVLRYKYILDRSQLGEGFVWEDCIPDREVRIPLKPSPPNSPPGVWLISDTAFGSGQTAELVELPNTEDRTFPVAKVWATCSADDEESARAPETTPEPTTIQDVKEVLKSSDGTFKNTYEILGEAPLARGGFSTVWRCRARQGSCCDDRVDLAVKQLDASKLTTRSRRFLFGGSNSSQGEIAIHSSLHHPKILELHQVFQDVDSISLVMEWCQGGDLLEIVLSHRYMHGRGLPEASVVSAGRQLMEAVTFLHGRSIIHRDVKCENLLQFEARGAVSTERAIFKLGDFGLAAWLLPDEVLLEQVGSPSTSAPEVVRGRPYAFAADIWSAGALLYTALAAHRPCDAIPCVDANAGRIHVQAEVNLVGGIWDDTSDDAKTLISSMLRSRADKRPSAKAVLCSQWLVHELVQNSPVET